MLAREAMRNVFAPGSHMLVVLALALLAGSGSSSYIALETELMRQEVHDLAADGHNVLVFSALSADEPARIERASCEALADEHGITHAGMLDHAGELNVMPVGTRLPAQRASVTLFPELAGADVLVGQRLSDRASRPFVVRAGQDLAVAVHADVRPEGLGTGSSITLPPRLSDVTSERCIVILDALSDVDVALAPVGAQLKVVGNLVSGSELMAATNDPIAEYLQRPSQWFPLLLGALGGIVTAVITRLRASEIATYRMSGTSPVSLMTLLSFEVLFIAGTAVLASTAASLVLATHYVDPAVPVLWGFALAGTWAVTALAASADLVVRRPNDLAKDR